MKLSAYPYVQVRIKCPKCKRAGAYRLARLAAKYGAEIELPVLLDKLAADCPKRDDKRLNHYDRCAAYFTEIGGPRPPDLPPKPQPTLRLVG